jgi:predicted transcriptional regulator
MGWLGDLLAAGQHDRKMERSRLRRCAGMRYALLEPILEELEKGGRINQLPGKEMIILRDR